MTTHIHLPVPGRVRLLEVLLPISGTIPSLTESLQQLSEFSDDSLIDQLKSTVARERKVTLVILTLLIEVERRGLHRERYSSLFAYCTDRLRYSRSAAGRRIAAARCLRDHPAVMPMLFDGRLNLTTLCILARVIRPENADELLGRAAGCNQAEAEELAAMYGAPARGRERIRPVRAPRPTPRKPASTHGAMGNPTRGATESGGDECVDGATGCGADIAEQERPAFRDKVHNGPTLAAAPATGRTSGDMDGSGGASGGDLGYSNGSGGSAGGAAGATGRAGGDSGLAAGATNGIGGDAGALAGTTNYTGSESDEDATADEVKENRADGESEEPEDLRFDITFRVDRPFMDRLERAQALASRGRADVSLADVFGQALDAYLDQHDPVRREARRGARKEARVARGRLRPQTRSDARRSACDPASGAGNRTRSESRHIPGQVRDQVMERDGMRCTFMGAEGRCPATRRLHLDHVHPYALGGGSVPSNLRLRCASHNQLAADQVFGDTFMKASRATPAPGLGSDRTTKSRYSRAGTG